METQKITDLFECDYNLEHVSAYRDAKVFSFENPQKSLNRDEHNRIYDALIPVTSNSFGADMTSYWKTRKKEGYLERLEKFLLITDEDLNIVGWTGYHVLPFQESTILYLDSTGTISTRQSKGIITNILKDMFQEAISNCDQSLPIYLTARTESPVLYYVLSKILGKDTLYPNPKNITTDSSKLAAKLLADWLGQSDLLEEDKYILRNAYTMVTELYAEPPTTGILEVDQLFSQNLRPVDAFIVVSEHAK